MHNQQKRQPFLISELFIKSGAGFRWKTL